MDPPTETNRHSHQGHSSVFVPERDKFLSGTCFEMVGAHPSMPYTFGGCGNLAPTGNEECVGKGKTGERSQNYLGEGW